MNVLLRHGYGMPADMIMLVGCVLLIVAVVTIVLMARDNRGMIFDGQRFYRAERGAPILRRNAGFVPTPTGMYRLWKPSSKNEQLISSISEFARRGPKAWRLLGRTAVSAELARIVRADAERTFQDERYRRRLEVTLTRFIAIEGDYHQGLGYAASFLLLFVGERTALRALLHLSRARLAGYWRAAPAAYVRDARVFARLLEAHEPQVVALLECAGIVPEAFASKWFVGLCVQVLPFPALSVFLQRLLADQDGTYLFDFGLRLVAMIRVELLATSHDNVSRLFACLRLEPAVVALSASAYAELAALRGATVALSATQLAELRVECAVGVQAQLAHAQEREEELWEAAEVVPEVDQQAVLAAFLAGGGGGDGGLVAPMLVRQASEAPLPDDDEVEEADEDGVGGDLPEDFVPEGHFAPTVRLAEVETRSGEEDEQLVLETRRVRLFWWTTDTWEKEVRLWKARGEGPLRLLRTATGGARLVCRQERVLRLAANVSLSSATALKEMEGCGGLAWIFSGLDAVDGTKLRPCHPAPATLAVKFASADEATAFVERYEQLRLASATPAAPAPVAAPAPKRRRPQRSPARR